MNTKTASKLDIRFDFLQTWTPALAWWLGLFYGDGNVYTGHGEYRISVACNPNTSVKWKNLICPDAKHQDKGPVCWVNYIDCKALTEWFIDRGVGPRKTETLTWPEWLPKELYSHFIRGLIDSDGSITIEERRERQGNDCLAFNFSAKNKVFCDRLKNEIMSGADVGEVVTSIVSSTVQDGSMVFNHRFAYRGGTAVKVCDFIYGESFDEIRDLGRYETYMGYKNWRINFNCDRCSLPAWSDDLCQSCWWDKRAEDNPKATCLIENCEDLVVAKGMCKNCYDKKKRQDNPDYRKTPNTICVQCGIECRARKGLCTACYSRDRRAKQKIIKESNK